MEHLRGVLGAALDEAASGRWREPVATLLDGKGTARARPAGRPGAAQADDDRPSSWPSTVRRCGWSISTASAPACASSAAAWTRAWPETSRWPTRTRPTGCRRILRALAAEGAGHEVVCEAEYALARDAIGARGARRASSTARSSPMRCSSARRPTARWSSSTPSPSSRGPRAPASSASACASRCPGIGVEPTRFGIAPARVPEAAARARALGLELEALSAHLVSTGFEQPARRRAPRLGAAITVQWPPAPGGPRGGRGAPGATWPSASASAAIDLGGGFPAAPAVAAHAAAVAGALRSPRLRRAPDPRAGPRPGHRRRGARVQRGRGQAPGRRHALRRRRRGDEPAARRAVVVAADRDGPRRRRAADGAGARQRPAVPERRRPAPGGGSCPR